MQSATNSYRDAEIASLTLTIPSWNSSIERVLKVSDFKIASDTAKYKLKYQADVPNINHK